MALFKCPKCSKPLHPIAGSGGQHAQCESCGSVLQLPPLAPGTRGRSDSDTGGPPANEDLDASSQPDASLRQLGRFIIRARLGSGAFGIVYRAHDPVLDREVALKVPHPGMLQTEQDRIRFLREPKAAAQLRHPNIVPVHEAGVDSGNFYIASALIEGQTLERVIDSGKPDCEEAARIVKDVAGAVYYAHGQGIVHRDVKPANIILDAKRIPMLMDFGLASFQEEQHKLTHEGTVVGTPAYMSPEQAQGSKAIAASDQYSLGVVLYELLTGERPFNGPPALVISLVLNHEPTSPRMHDSRIPRDLETICLKAMAKNAAQRYADCQQLADDLRRWLDGEPIHARRVGLLERSIRWARKNPIPAGLTGLAAMLLLVIAVGSLLFAASLAVAKQRADDALLTAQTQTKRANQESRRADGKTEEALANLELAEGRARDVTRQSYLNAIALAHLEWQGNNVAGADRILDECPPDMRDWEWFYLKRLCHSDLFTLRAHTSAFSVAFSHDGQRLATAGSGFEDDDGKNRGWRGEVKVWDAQSGQGLLVLPEFSRPIRSVAFSPDGTQLAIGGDLNVVTLWDSHTGQELTKLRGYRDMVFGPPPDRDFSDAAGATTLTSYGRAGIQFHGNDFNTAARTSQSFRMKVGVLGETAGLAYRLRGVASLMFNHDGTRLITCGYGPLKLWDLEKATNLQHSGDFGLAYSIAFSPDGKFAAAGRSEGTSQNDVTVWNTSTGKDVLHLPYPGSVSAVAYSPDGTKIATAYETDRIVKTWNATDGTPLATYRGHTHFVTGVAFQAGSRWLASSSADKTVKFWDTSLLPLPVKVNASEASVVGDEVLTIRGHNSTLENLTFSPTGDRIASCSSDGFVKVWQAGDQEYTRFTPVAAQMYHAFCVRPDGKQAAVSWSPPGDVANPTAPWLNHTSIFDLETSQELQRLPITERKALLEYTPDGQHLITAGQSGALQLWDLASGTSSVSFGGSSQLIRSLALSGDGQRLASTDDDQRLHVWDVAMGKPVCDLPLDEPTSSLALDAGGSHVAYPKGKEVVIHEIATQQQSRLPGAAALVKTLAYSRDGHELLCGYGDGSLRLWKAASGELLHVCQGHTGGVISVAFSSSGNRLLSSSVDGTMRTWDARSGLQILKLRTPEMATRLSVVPDRNLIIAGQSAGLVIWNGQWPRPILFTDGISPAMPSPELASYEIFVEPANAQLSVSGKEGRVFGTGSQRRLEIDDGDSQTPVTLVVEADGYQSRQWQWTPVGGERASLAFRLEQPAALAYRRGVAAFDDGDFALAVEYLTLAVREDEQATAGRWLLARILACCPEPAVRNGQRAIAEATKACEATAWKEPAIIDTLAAAYAEAGDFPGAVKWQKAVIEQTAPAGKESARQRLRLYESGQAFHEKNEYD